LKAESDEGTNHIIKKGKHGNQISAINSLEMNYSWQISPKTASETCSTGTHTPQNKIADLQTEKDGQQSFFIFHLMTKILTAVLPQVVLVTVSVLMNYLKLDHKKNRSSSLFSLTIHLRVLRIILLKKNVLKACTLL